MSIQNSKSTTNKRNYGLMEQTFFKVHQLQTEDFLKGVTRDGKFKQAPKYYDFGARFNEIFLDVHDKLREQETYPKKFKTATNLKKKNFNKKVEKLAPLNILSPDIESAFNSTNNGKTPKISIARLKVLHQDKQQERLCSIPNVNQFEDHQRMLKALRRQNDLQTLLEEQKLIKLERQSLAHDVFAMRHCLDDIQHRVKRSAKELESKKTYCECHGIVKNNKCKKVLKPDEVKSAPKISITTNKD